MMACLCANVELQCIFQALLLVYSGGIPGASPPPLPSICCGSGYWVYSSSDDIIDPKARLLSRNGLILTYSIPGSKKKHCNQWL